MVAVTLTPRLPQPGETWRDKRDHRHVIYEANVQTAWGGECQYLSIFPDGTKLRTVVPKSVFLAWYEPA